MSGSTQRAEESTLGSRLATGVSYVINPLIIPPIEFGLVLWHFAAGSVEIGKVVAIGLVFFFLVPLVYVVRLVRRGKAATIEIRSQGLRTGPFLFGIASYLIGIVFLWITVRTARPIILTLAAIYPINTALVALINLRWKISVHVTSIAGLLAALFFVAQYSSGIPPRSILTVASVAPWLLLIPLVMWARVRSGAHTVPQVVGGAAFGFVMTMAQLFAALGTIMRA